MLRKCLSLLLRRERGKQMGWGDDATLRVKLGRVYEVHRSEGGGACKFPKLLYFGELHTAIIAETNP